MEIYIKVLIVLSILGIIDSGYLIWKRVRNEKLACPINEHSCNVVTESKWSSTFGVKNDISGFFYYIFILTASFLIIYYNFIYAKNILLLISGISLLFSGFLVYVQARILRQYCFYCLVSALINLLIFLDIVALV